MGWRGRWADDLQGMAIEAQGNVMGALSESEFKEETEASKGEACASYQHTWFSPTQAFVRGLESCEGVGAPLYP